MTPDPGSSGTYAAVLRYRTWPADEERPSDDDETGWSEMPILTASDFAPTWEQMNQILKNVIPEGHVLIAYNVVA